MFSLNTVDSKSETLSAEIMDDCSSSDENVENQETRPKLGFKPQKEIVFNKLLPYSESLDEESQEMLNDIKGNLGKCVLLKDIKPGCIIWVHRLTRYIRMFGLKFSKEDHIIFIKLIYELITIPGLEPNLLYRFYTCLTQLLKKKELITREDLTLPWRPLYEIVEYEMNKSNSNIGMYKYNQRREVSFSDLVSLARVYFPPSATQEMLDLWRPQLCPVVPMCMTNAVAYFDTFLPVNPLDHERALGYELWFNEFMDLWNTCHNAPPWEFDMMNLMARLAHHNVGHIDWEPYIPLMYTRILRSFGLPVHYKKRKTNKDHKFNTLAVSSWIVATLGGGSSSQKYLTRLMKVLESYFHPANLGSWVIRLQKFLRKLPNSFIFRLNRERNHKQGWLPETPVGARLTEDDITQFVESMAPTVTQAMYSRMPTAGSLALQYLATLRPSIVIPRVIESMYNTMDSLTEPHKYTSAMLSLVSVARQIVEPNEYKEGPTHVIPLLRAVLPGIDPNDIRKCFITFQVITSFTSMIPLVDSSNASEYWKDLTEEEEVVCAATSQLEDFVLEFLDRCFSLVDTIVLESTRLEQSDQSKQVQSRMEHMNERLIESTICGVLWQTSPQIFKSALHKLHTFVTSRIFETVVSGKCIASICRTFAKIRPEETLKLLVPNFCQIILSHLENDDIKEEETLDNELLYNLLLLSEVVRCFDKAVMNYAEVLEKVLDSALHLKCWEGYNLASKLLANLLSGLATTRLQELKSSNQDFSKHISEYLPVREWAKAYKIHDVHVDWYIPGTAEVNYVQKLLAKYLIPELETIKAYSKGSHDLARKELQCSLTIVLACLGCGRLLPLWEDEIPLSEQSESKVTDIVYFKCIYAGKATMPDGSNVRKAVLSVISELQDKLLTSAEDDTKSLNLIVTILDALLSNMKPAIEEFETQSKAMSMSKKIFENKLLGKTRHLRPVVVNQIYHQHETLHAFNTTKTTESHAQIIYRLLELSTSHYSEVRRNAQGKLNSALTYCKIDGTMLVPKIVDILKQDCNQHHEQYKGVLYVLLGPKHNPLIARRNWHLIQQIWSTLLQAQPSEKPSIIALLNALGDSINKYFFTININLKVESKAEVDDVARSLWRLSLPTPQVKEPTEEDVANGSKQLIALNDSNKADYLQLLDSILTSINSNLHWRYHFLALEFIQNLVNPDLPYPPQTIRNILQTLIHDTIEFRKIAIRCTVYVLKQQKRKHKYRTIEVERSRSSPQNYGDREDNQWLQYNSSNVPQSADDWDQPRFNHNQHVGYYTWPQEVKVNGLSSDQPTLDRTQSELSPGEREVDDFFSDPVKIEKLISYLSLEDKKGKDKFDAMRFILFKNLFQNHGDKYLEIFKPHLERLIADKHESNQRCAAEIITGLIRGSKHWPYDKVEKMWQYLSPLLRTAFANMTVETVNDWSVLAATASENRDPNRYHWLLELLMEDPLREGASFIDCGRLCALQGALNQQGWRITELSSRLLEYLTPKLSHPYQLLRERIGSVLVNIFAADLPSSGIRRTRGPSISQFVSGIIPQLMCLYSLSETSSTHLSASSEASGSLMEVCSPLNDTINTIEENGKNKTICLLKTMIKWVTNSVVRSNYSMIPEFWAFLPLVSLMENYEADDELNKICSSMLAALAQSLVLPEFMPTALSAIQEVCEMSSWSARATCLEFFQVFVFHNMAIICSQDSWVNQVNSLVLRLLKDERVEVREKAGEMLSGLIHCCFISDPQQLLTDLKRLASKQKKGGINEIAKRHAGVLGLCAFISANPYDVVDPVPEIFLLLGSHLNDPQPIPSSIRKILGDFKRTHHDNWEQHKLKFTEEQLTVLTDMVVPPSYYA